MTESDHITLANTSVLLRAAIKDTQGVGTKQSIDRTDIRCFFFRFAASLLGGSLAHDIFKGSNNMSRIVRKPDFCLCENKGADQLRGNREADQRLCFRHSDSTIPLLLIAKISSI